VRLSAAIPCPTKHGLISVNDVDVAGDVKSAVVFISISVMPTTEARLPITYRTSYPHPSMVGRSIILNIRRLEIVFDDSLCVAIAFSRFWMNWKKPPPWTAALLKNREKLSQIIDRILEIIREHKTFALSVTFVRMATASAHNSALRLRSSTKARTSLYGMRIQSPE